MSDNVLLNPGYGGSTIRTVDVGNVQTQVVIPAFSYVDGVITNTSAARPFPVIQADTFIPLGTVTGFSAFRKFGQNSAIGAGETYIGTIGGSAPYMPTTATTIEAISSDVNDTAAGTGTRQITVVGLDSNWNEATVTLTMAGTNATAASTTSFFRVYRAYGSVQGAYRGTNAGTITIRASGAGTSFASIGIGRGQSQGTHYCVPAGYSLLVQDVHMVIDATKAVNVIFWQAPNANDVTTPFSGAKRVIQNYAGANGTTDFEYHPPMLFNAYTDLWFSGTASGGGGGCSCEYVGYLVTL